MGRKVHPYGFRIGVVKDWRAKWFAEGDQYADQLMEDLAVRRLVTKTIGRAGISDITIERFPKQVSITIHTAKPGIVIGRKGASVNVLRKKLEEMTRKKIKIEVEEISKPEASAHLIAESIAEQLEKRVSHKRAMKQAVQRAMRAGAKGVRIQVAGRLAGSEMARRDSNQDGRIPRQTLRADIDFAQNEALTTYGRIGVKVWVYKGEVLPILQPAVG